MVTDKITTEDIQNLAKGILKVTLPDYRACRSAMSMVTYTKDAWTKKDGIGYTSSIDKETNTITISVLNNQRVLNQ